MKKISGRPKHYCRGDVLGIVPGRKTRWGMAKKAAKAGMIGPIFSRDSG